MRKLMTFAVLVCGAQMAFGQACGSTRDTDYAGTYTSSTSSDHCAYGPLLSKVHSNSLSVFAYSADTQLLLLPDYSSFAGNFIRREFDQIKLPEKTVDEATTSEARRVAPAGTTAVTSGSPATSLPVTTVRGPRHARPTLPQILRPEPVSEKANQSEPPPDPAPTGDAAKRSRA